jgi:hypothetical protein
MEHTTTGVVDKREFLDTRPPFSSFDYIDKNFGDCLPARRLFSQARYANMCSVVSEIISPAGFIADENDEIKGVYPDYQMDQLRRLTFWSEMVASCEDVSKVHPDACIGYVLLKQESVGSLWKWRWHVFESVMRPSKFPHSYIHGWKKFRVRCCDREFEVPGVLYCQQNNLNKACAQVALRVLCSLHVDEAQVSFRKINDLAARVSGPFDKSQGLVVPQIRAVLDGFGIEYTDIDYTTGDETDRSTFAYQKFLYAGIESGAGALLGFKLAGPTAFGHHIIPFFGHTFNRDTWVPNAEAAYFHVGEDTKYIPSESWVSTFVGHDDNFGSNYCIPRLYITPEQAQYVASLYPKNTRYGGVEAETIAVNVLYSIRKTIVPKDLPWQRRALDAIDKQNVVLRSVSLGRNEYIDHLRSSKDWQGQSEASDVCDGLASSLPENLWMIELSVPELFPTNLRKFGEILLNASKEPISGTEVQNFILARVPGDYILQAGSDETGTPKFTLGPSNIKSHTPLYSREQPAE